MQLRGQVVQMTNAQTESSKTRLEKISRLQFAKQAQLNVFLEKWQR